MMSLLAATTLFFESGGTEIMAHENWQRVKEVFADALRQKPEMRPEFLDKVCRDDKNLRREIESLLASFDSAESFMETPAVGDQVSLESRKFAKGETLAHYEIIRQIGTGGMGDVYLAQDSKLHRPVALKILREGLASEIHAQERLLREARAVAKLNHPNICAIYEISETKSESFIVMEYASGETLADILTKERLSAKKSLEFTIQIADALGEAHAHKIIHRDIKPANIVVNKKGNLKVLDFGLAKIIEAETDSKATKNMSSSGAIMGTVPYMSPEQLRGKTLDARTDIFSFGVLFYEMLSGISPFQNNSNAETISAILNDEPDLSRIPSELQSIIQKCLAKDTNERYQTAQDLLFDLKNLPLESFENTDFQIQSPTVQELQFSTDENQSPITKDEPQTISPTNNRRWIWAISALAVLFAGFAGWAWQLNSSWLESDNISTFDKMKQPHSTQSDNNFNSNVVSKLYWQMTEAEQIAFIRNRAQDIELLIGDEPTEFDEEALRAIKIEIEDFLLVKDSLSQKPFEEGLRVIYGRASQYVPIVIRAYEARKITPALGVYTAMVESEYNDCHISKIGTVGLFLFKPSTAQKYGLKRKDYCSVEKQSDAAARYMSDLATDFGEEKSSQTLILFAFNQGEEQVRDYLRQLRGHGITERSFWTIFRHRKKLKISLTEEGEYYVPRFFAAAIIGETPQVFDLSTPPLTTLREITEN